MNLVSEHARDSDIEIVGLAVNPFLIREQTDALVMVLLGGVQTLAGPVVGAAAFTWLHDTVARNTEYWRALMGATMLILVLLAPQGIAGYAQLLWSRVSARDQSGARQ